MIYGKTDYVLKTLAKIAHKRWEFYIISRIIHQLDDDIEFVRQQLVRFNDGRFALTDLYFPQFNLHLEIDEPHHENQRTADEQRQYDIVNAVNHDVKRIAISSSGVVKPLEVINSEVDEFVRLIKNRKDKSTQSEKFVPWDFDKRYSSGPVIERGYVSIVDNVLFRKQVEALRCFGFTGSSLQRGAWKIPDGSEDQVWFPRLYKYKIWENELSADGEVIYERAIDEEGIKSIAKQKIDWKRKQKRNPNSKAIVFAKARDPLGENLLRYVGSFVVDWDKSSEKALAFKRVAVEEKIRVRN